MGKFYELFEMDAHVGAKELDLQYMKVFFSLILFVSSSSSSSLSVICIPALYISLNLFGTLMTCTRWCLALDWFGP